MSGAGRSTAAATFEDAGWFVVDNLPPELADGVIDTTDYNVHQLRDRINDIFAAEIRNGAKLRIAVVSFGYSHGLPRDADLVFDCRFLPNPHWIPELRPHTGLDADVRDYVF